MYETKSIAGMRLWIVVTGLFFLVFLLSVPCLLPDIRKVLTNCHSALKKSVLPRKRFSTIQGFA